MEFGTPKPSMEEEKEKTIDSKQERYREGASVNGIEFNVSYVEDFGKYEILFPQIENLNEQSISNALLISEDKEKAKKVFEFTKQAAEQEKDISKLSKKVEDFIYDLTEDED